MPSRVSKLRIALEFNPYLPWNRGLLRGIEAFARQRDDWELRIHRLVAHGPIRLAADGEVDGVIASAPVGWAMKKRVPQVVLSASAGGCPRVESDFSAMGRMAVDLTVKAGYPVLAMFPMVGSNSADRLRDAGAREEASLRELPLHRVALGGQAAASGEVVLRRADQSALAARLRDLPVPFCFFARNLSEALVVHSALLSAGLEIPHHAGVVVGGNDDDLLAGLVPPLTGIRRSSHAVGYQAAGLLQDLLEGKKVPERTVVPPIGIVDRGSTRLQETRDPVVLDALRLIREHVANPLPVPELCRKLGVSEAGLRRRFRKALGQSPLDAVRSARLERARRLLETSGMGLSEVSEACGFAESSQLSREIRRATGMTPTQIRRLALER